MYYYYYIITSSNDIQPSTLITDQSPSGLLLDIKAQDTVYVLSPNTLHIATLQPYKAKLLPGRV